MVDTEVICRPSPDELRNVIYNQEKGNESDEKREESALARAGFVGGGKLREGVELVQRGGCGLVELVEDGLLFHRRVLMRRREERRGNERGERRRTWLYKT